MKNTLIALALLAAAGTASAQATFGLLNPRGAGAALLSGTPTLAGGLGPSAPSFLAGNTVDGFAAGRNGFISAVNVLTFDTPRLAGLANANAALFTRGYQVLLPVYQALDPVLMQIAAPGAPLTQPIGAEIVNGAKFLSNLLNGPALRLTTLAGLGGMSF